MPFDAARTMSRRQLGHGRRSIDWHAARGLGQASTTAATRTLMPARSRHVRRQAHAIRLSAGARAAPPAPSVLPGGRGLRTSDHAATKRRIASQLTNVFALSASQDDSTWRLA